MIKNFDDEPLLHAMMGACRDIILQELPCLGNGFIRDLLKGRDLVPKGIGVLSNRKSLMRNALEHFSQVDTASFFAKTLPPCWNRTILLPFLIMKMGRGEGVPHPELLLGW
jgi:hypothetical protein